MAFYTPVAAQPTLADRKATFLLTMTGLMATTLFFFVDTLERMIGGPDRVHAVVLAVLASTLVGLLLAVAVHAYTAYVAPLPAHPALSFPRHLGGHAPETYAALMRAMTPRESVEAILHYNYSAATQAVAKYRSVNKALACARWAIPLWMAVLLLVALWR
jgi:hypothetical protein